MYPRNVWEYETDFADDIVGIKTGYISQAGLNLACCMEYEDAHQALTSLKGVGDKVADCILLFGCGHTSAFPVDVWVEKLMKSWFGVCGCSRKKMMCLAREKLGAHAGLLQQFLFHAARMGDMEL